MLKIGGVEVGRVRNVTADSDFRLEDVSGISNILAQEHVNTRVTQSIIVDKFIINKKILLKIGWVPVSEDLLQMRVIYIEILLKEEHLN